MSDPHPDSRRDLVRYIVISCVAGSADFLIALVMLHTGFSPAVSLACSIIIAGVAQYLALEWWGSSRRSGRFSLQRLVESGLVELGTYIIRLIVLSVWRHMFPVDGPLDHATGLAVAYAVAFLFGFIVRTRMIFVRNGGKSGGVEA